MPPKTSKKTTSTEIQAPSHRSHIGSVRSLPATGRARRLTSWSSTGEQPLSTSTAATSAVSFIRPTGCLPGPCQSCDDISTILQRSAQFERGIDVGGGRVSVGRTEALEEPDRKSTRLNSSHL